jgi:hypothetical protein
MFLCPVTGKPFLLEADALKCAEAARRKVAREKEARKKERERAAAEEALALIKQDKADYIRLNLENVSALVPMMVSKMKEFYNIDLIDLRITANFTDALSCSHNSPIGCPTNWGSRDKDAPSNYPGWSGRIECQGKAPKEIIGTGHHKEDGISERLFGRWSHGNLISGFHTSSGCGGRFNGDCHLSMGFGFFLQDFPKLLAKHLIWTENRRLTNSNNTMMNELMNDARAYASHQETYVDLIEEIGRLEYLKTESFNRGMQEFRDSHPVRLHEVVPEYAELCNNFGGRNYR